MARVVRQVWGYNLMEELTVIRRFSNFVRCIAIDTEFPGTVWKPKQAVSTMLSADHYSLMKKNVDSTNIIQLGLTLSNSNFHCTWEFNFHNFDLDRDLHDPHTIALLQKQGTDFSMNKRHGINANAFGYLLVASSGLIGLRSRNRIWITFHALYDLGYMIKIMTGRPLPDDLGQFMRVVGDYFGDKVYDLKPIAHGMRLGGGLEKLAKVLGLARADGGKRHQAGSDSLLMMEAFVRMVVNSHCRSHILMRYRHVLYGLTWLPKY